VGTELSIPVYLYEEAQKNQARKSLSHIREGEYEGFFTKISNPIWLPDFGPSTFNPHTGATVIGARSFLVAYNINLNTKSVRKANAVAFDVREAGRVKRSGDPLTGPVERDTDGNEIRIPGTLKAVKAIGWYIEEYGIAQISMNLTDIGATPVHVAFEEVCRCAGERGLRVTGSELVGLLPLHCLLDAGRYFLKKQKSSAGVSEEELVEAAVKSLGLNDLSTFDPQKKVIEYVMRDSDAKSLVSLSAKGFANETASDSPAPGGGSVAAYVGALGISLGTMVANLSAGKRGWDDRWEEFSDWAEKGRAQQKALLQLVDEDTDAFNRIMTAFGLPKATDEEKRIRKNAIQDATRHAMEVPYRVMEISLASMEVIRAMAMGGNPNSVSDAGVGVLCARTAVKGALLNVKINAAGLDDKAFVTDMIGRAEAMERQAEEMEKEILVLVEKVIVSH
jgi:glutamate formiminotransferase/formiminotetrahydrofolate cyclodeaminase